MCILGFTLLGTLGAIKGASVAASSAVGSFFGVGAPGLGTLGQIGGAIGSPLGIGGGGATAGQFSIPTVQSIIAAGAPAAPGSGVLAPAVAPGLSTAAKIGIGLTAAGAVGSSTQSVVSAVYAGNVADANAEITRQTAKFAQDQADIDASYERMANSFLAADITAATAASGADPGSGSALGLIRREGYLSGLKVDRINANAAFEQYGYQVAQVDIAAQRDIAAMRGGFDAAGALVAGGSSIYTQSALLRREGRSTRGSGIGTSSFFSGPRFAPVG